MGGEVSWDFYFRAWRQSENDWARTICPKALMLQVTWVQKATSWKLEALWLEVIKYTKAKLTGCLLLKYINQTLKWATIAKAHWQHPMYSMVLCSLDPKLFFSIPDDDTLVLSVNYHISVHIICKSIDMWWVLILCLEKQNKTKPWSDKSNTFLLLALEMNMPLYRLKGCVIQES